MRLRVDEARRHGQAVRVDHACRRCAAEAAHRRDAAVADRDVRGQPGIAGAIEDAAVAKQDVAARWLWLTEGRRPERTDE